MLSEFQVNNSKAGPWGAGLNLSSVDSLWFLTVWLSTAAICHIATGWARQSWITAVPLTAGNAFFALVGALHAIAFADP